jgi:hypothetical protein
MEIFNFKDKHTYYLKSQRVTFALMKRIDEKHVKKLCAFTPRMINRYFLIFVIFASNYEKKARIFNAFLKI